MKLPFISFAFLSLVVLACNDTPTPTISTNETASEVGNEAILKGKLILSDGTLYETTEETRIQLPEAYSMSIEKGKLAKGSGNYTVTYISGSFSLDGTLTITKHNISVSDGGNLLKWNNFGEVFTAGATSSPIDFYDTITEGSLSSTGAEHFNQLIQSGKRLTTVGAPGITACMSGNDIDEVKGKLTTDWLVNFEDWSSQISTQLVSSGFCQ